MRKGLRRWLLAGAAAALVLAAAAGLASATASDNGTLGACAKTTDGQLRLDTGDGCLPSEQAVELGTAAASRADERYYVAPNLRDLSTYLPLSTSVADQTRVVTMHVPAGNYRIGAEIVFTNRSGDASLVCLLLDGAGVTHGYAQASVGVDAGFNRDEVMNIDGALSLTAATDISLSCWAASAGYPQGTTLVRAADITTSTVDAAAITQETH